MTLISGFPSTISILPCDANDLSLKHGETLIVRHFRTYRQPPFHIAAAQPLYPADTVNFDA
jgi:hypothetical protein